MSASVASTPTASFPKAIKSREEFIAFIKTYDKKDPSQFQILFETGSAGTVPAMVKLAVEAGRFDTVSSLLPFVDINYVDIDKQNAILTAIDKCDFESFYLLLSKNPDLHYGDDQEKGAPLVRICSAGLTAFLFYLIIHIIKLASDADEFKREINWPRKTPLLHTPLVMAVLRHRYNIVEMLCGIDINLNEPCRIIQNTSLHFAARSGDLQMVKILLLYGADPSRLDKYGKTPSTIATDFRFPEVSALLKDAESGKLPTAFHSTNANNDVKYMFSQRGETCGSDSAMTILFEADPIRKDFQSTLTDDTYSRSFLPNIPKNIGKLPLNEYLKALNLVEVRKKNAYQNILLHTIPRYKKMKTLEESTRNTRRRSGSLNAGEGVKMLQCLSSPSAGRPGVEPEDVFNFFNRILVENKLHVLKENYNIRVRPVFLRTKTPLPPFANIFAIWLTVAERSSTGHAVCLLKQAGIWYFGDANVGLLHKFSDHSFVSGFYEDLANYETRTNIAYMPRKDRVTSSSSMTGYLFKTDSHYPADLHVFDLESFRRFQMFNVALVLYQMDSVAPVAGSAAAFGGSGTTAGGMRRHTRRTRRRAWGTATL